MTYRGPKAKRSRALGVALTEKAAAIMNKRPNPPGMHGQRRRASRSDFGEQLKEKQRLKFQYNISERSLKKTFQEAKRLKGNSADNLMKLLEHRLDSFVYRAGFAPTVYAARQLVSHGHVRINGKKATRRSMVVGSEDTVSLSEKGKTIGICQDALAGANPPAYIEVRKDEASAKFMREPQIEEIPIICRVPMVVEFYSK